MSGYPHFENKRCPNCGGQMTYNYKWDKWKCNNYSCNMVIGDNTQSFQSTLTPKITTTKYYG